MPVILRRGVDASMLAALSADVIHPVALVWLDWPGGAVRVHSNLGDILWAGEVWRGVGNLGGISLPEESGGLASVEATLQLVGATEEVFERVEDPIKNHPGRILMGVTTERGGNVLIGQPTGLFVGAMDSSRAVVTGADGELEHGIEVTVGSGPGARSIASIYHSPEERARVAPGDTAGRHVINALTRVETQRWPEQ